MKYLRRAAWIVLVDTAGGAMPAALMYLFRVNQDVLLHLKFGEVYAHCIGTLCFLVVGPVAHRVSGLRRLSQFAVLALTMVSLAVIGAFPAGLIFVALHWLRPDEFWP